MRSRLGLAVSTIALTFAAGCSGKKVCDDGALFASDGKGGSPDGYENASMSPAPQSSAGAAQRAVAEADIVQLDGLRLYAMSKSGTLSVIDASQPGSLTLLGKTKLPGEPFEMYRRGDVIVVMSNKAVDKTGKVVISTGDETSEAPVNGSTTTTTDAGAGAIVVAIDVSNPAAPKEMGSLKVPGEIADSRTVGNVLYLATYENTDCFDCGSELRTLVTSFDISTPSAPKQVDQVTYKAPTGTVYNLAWSTAWRRSIFATNERLYVGGLSDTASANTKEGVIEVLDITDPSGKLVKGAHIDVAGPALSRWQMDESQGVFRVITQRGAGSTANGSAMPEIDTFQIASTSSFTPLGHTTMKLPKQEGLKTVRFDGERAYAITFNQTDPLFTIDLSNPAAPAQKGELHVPGWTFHLEPRGDKLIGLGLDRNDQNGSLNVSLYDVSNMADPKMLQRVAFGPNDLYEDFQITNGVLAEDQDRIQKSFRVFPDGLIVTPFSRPASGGGYESYDTCSGQGGGIQLIDWKGTTLTKRGLVTMAGNPRRALRRQFLEGSVVKNDELLGVSDSNVTAFDIDLRDAPAKTADLVIGTCVSRTSPSGGFVGGGGEGHPYDYYGDDRRRSSGSACE